jgi:serine protease Do
MGLEHNKGEFIQSVVPDGAGAKAGIQAGDVVVKVNGKEVTRDQTLSFLVANTAPGTRIPVELIRNGRRMTVTATVAKRPTDDELQQTFDPGTDQDSDPLGNSPKQADSAVQKSLGLSVTPLTPQIARQIGAAEGTRGLVIVGVDPSSDAGQKGFARGFIILSANNAPVTTQADLENAIKAAKADGRSAILLRVQPRGQPAAYVPVRLR